MIDKFCYFLLGKEGHFSNNLIISACEAWVKCIKIWLRIILFRERS